VLAAHAGQELEQGRPHQLLHVLDGERHLGLLVLALAQHSLVLLGRDGRRRLAELLLVHGAVEAALQGGHLRLVPGAHADLALVGHEALLVRVVGEVVVEAVLRERKGEKG